MISTRWAAILLCSGFGLLVFQSSVEGQTNNWTGGAGVGNQNWLTTTNWTVSGGPNPPSGGSATAILNFTATTTSINPVQNIGGDYTLNRINFSNSNFTLSSANRGLIFAGANAGIFTNAGTFTIDNSYSFSAAIQLSVATQFNAGLGGTLNVAGQVIGVGSLTMQGVGNVVLTNSNNSYSGGTTINGGVLEVLNDGCLGLSTASVTMNGSTLKITNGGNTNRTVTLNASGGTLDMNAQANFFNASIGGAGQLRVTNGGAYLFAANSYGGGTAVSNNGDVIIDADNKLGTAGTAVSLDNGIITFYNAGGPMNNSRPLTLLAGGGILDAANGNLWTWSGAIGGAGQLRTQGFGQIELSNANSYLGGTSVGGTTYLRISADNNLGAAGTGVTLDGGVLTTLTTFSTNRPFSVTANGGVIETQGDLTMTGSINGVGSWVKSGIGKLTLTTASGYLGNTQIAFGTLSVSNDNQLGVPASSVDFGSFGNGVFQVTGTGYTSTARSFIGGNFYRFDIANAANTFTISQNIVNFNGLYKYGPGTLVLTGNNGYFGSNNIVGGVLSVAADANLGVASADLEFDNNATLRITGNSYSSNTRQVLLFGAGGTIDIASAANSVAFNGPVSGTTLTKVGPGALVLTNSNGISNVNVNGGTLQAGNDNAFGSGVSMNTANVAGALLDINGYNVAIPTLSGGGPLGGDVALGGGILTVGSSNASTVFGGQIVGAGDFNKVGVGTLQFTGLASYSGDTLIQQGTLRVDGGMTAGGTVTVLGGTTLDARSNIARAISGVGSNSKILANNGNVSLGDSTSFLGFNHQGQLTVGSNAVTLDSAGYAQLGVLTTLAGGTMLAPNGISLGSSSNFSGFGAINAPIVTSPGSVIQATGALALGDASTPAGFVANGELRTGTNTVTLNSSSWASLGNLTKLGVGGTPGTLIAGNGLVVDFGRSVTGYGTINTPNNIAQRLINNGTINGTSFANQITLTGWVKGVGTYNNVTVAGTFDPGFSPTLLTVGNLNFGPTNNLIMELGGLCGTQYDAIDASGTLGLNGTMSVQLINVFNPSLGDTFDLFNWNTMFGTFSNLNLPALSPGLAWDTTQLYTLGWIVITPVPEPSQIFCFSAAAFGIVAAYRRRKSA